MFFTYFKKVFNFIDLGLDLCPSPRAQWGGDGSPEPKKAKEPTATLTTKKDRPTTCSTFYTPCVLALTSNLYVHAS